MRFYLSLLGMCIFLSACSKKTERILLQEKEIALAQPRISSSSAIIDSSVLISADLRLDGVKIFYTNDNSEPTTQAKEYQESFESSVEGTYKFKAFHPSWKSSETAVLKLYKKGISPSKIDWITNSSNSYKGIGTTTLINNEKAPISFRNKQWVGFDSVAVAEVYFENKTFVETIDIGYLVDTQSWIFPPSSIMININGTDLVEVKIPNLKQAEPKSLRNYQVKIGRELISMKIEVKNLMKIPAWHDGKGTKAWLFMDEWIFK